MKNKTKLTGLELNCIEVAVQHLIDELEDALKDKMDSFYVYKSLKERLNATQSAKKKLWNLGGLIDDLEQSHYPVTAQQVAKFTDTFDHGDSDSWIADILNAEVNVPKLRHAIRNLDEKNPGDVKYLYGKGIE
jgi:cell fate (sporulation/competence/biofilm development) regulator YlbF (YheA/YmcA/DUF963 family)